MTIDAKRVFDTPWFSVVETPQPTGEPYYMLTLPDYVTVVALTSTRHILLVRQFRPVVQRESTELPSGHVEANESPEHAAHRELLEETGYVAPRLELLGTLVPDVGRLANRMWCYFAADVTPAAEAYEPEAGVSMIQMSEGDVLRQAAEGTIGHALNLAVLFLGVAAGKLRFD
jgi:ADP-ribose pyrophosphatase